jgi:GR25 family glycosyltransferase involved in LPS biosynthesis
MKHYVITIMDNPRSVNVAERCIKSGAKNGIEIEHFPAITPHNTDIHKILKDEGISIDGFKELYSRLDNCIAAFLSHYSLWKLAAETNDTVTIFEHDAVVVDKIPDIPFTQCISFGKPSYGKFRMPAKLGVGPLNSKPYFPGAHAYRVNYKGAEQLIYQAKRHAKPTDVFLNIHTFPSLQEYYPWPVEAHDNFTTIQNERGCLAKHNYNETYKIEEAR